MSRRLAFCRSAFLIEDPHRVRRTAIAWVFGLGSLVGIAGAGPRVESLTPLAVSVPEVVQISQLLGRADTGTLLHLNVSLNPSRPSALRAFADSVSSPGDPNFRKFISPAMVGKLFGPSQQNVDSVVQYLQSEGMTVKRVATNRMNLMVQSTVAQAEQAFHTRINRYRSSQPSDSARPEFYAFSVTPQIQATLAPTVLSVAGLENYEHGVPASHRAKQGGTSGPFSPQQVSSLYNLNPLQSSYEGQGRTVGITNFGGFAISNVPLFCTRFSLPTPSAGAGTNVSVVTIDGGSQGDTPSGECDNDIQMVLGQAPLSNVVVYDAINDFAGYEDLLTQEVDDNIADTVSESWLWHMTSTTNMEALHNLHLSMTAQGITYSVCSGDWGSNYQQYDYPQSEPEITSVGGSVATLNSSGQRASEVTWIDGGGGWITTDTSFNTLPSWQVGTGVPTNENFRLAPDVAMISSGSNAGTGKTTGAIVFYCQGELYYFYGTSVASPLFAGSLAVVEQDAIANGALPANSSGKRRLGRVNDYLYRLNGNPSAFFDITSGSNGTLPSGSASNAAVGWDYATGWGAPNFAGLAAKIVADSAPAGLTVAHSSVLGGSSVTATVVLPKPAPSGGALVELNSQIPSYVGVPSSITIPQGEVKGQFQVTTKPFRQTYTNVIKAAYGGSAYSATLTVIDDSISGVTLSPVSVLGGASSTGTINLLQAAPTGGWVVKLTSQIPSYVAVPASITIAAGASSGTFSITTKSFRQTYTNEITATDATSSKAVTLSIVDDSISTLALSPATVSGGTSSKGTVTLLQPAPAGGWKVTLASQIPSYVSVPASVTVAAGSTTATFTATTKAFRENYTNMIEAADATSTKTVTLTVTGDSVASVTLSPSSVVGGKSSIGTVTLLQAAPAGGWVVKLTSQIPTYVSVPATVTIPAGSTTGTFTATTKTFRQNYTNTITASDAISSQKATLTITTG